MNVRILLAVSAVLGLLGASLHFLPAEPSFRNGEGDVSEENTAPIRQAQSLIWPEARFLPAGMIGHSEPEPSPQTEATPPALRFQLLGITRTNDQYLAWVSVDGQPASRLAIGDEIGRWRVAAIEPIALYLADGDDERRLGLFGPR